MAFEKEADFEAALINLLTEKYGWESEILRYKTEEELIQNWKQILFENNRDIDRLNDVPLTDGEMQQILDQITRLRTPLKLNGFINGKTVAIKRDNPADTLHFGKEVSLKIYDQREIAAGQSRYQIAQQPVFKARSAVLSNRRGDFMLLINGMPLIHCELKRSGVDVSQAHNQIEKYAHEGVFSGLFSLVQIFIAMQPDETVYFANPGPDGVFNKDFYFHWADANNEPLNNWKDIAQYLLSIPMAHQLIGFYTVADDTDGILKVMRSYQYYAASRITGRVAMRRWADKDQYGGYIWHTTGSGKTLTSFKSAQLIAGSRDADKVVFLMDRVELGTQSLMDYRGFADDAGSVQDTEDTNVLVAKLKSNDPANMLIVTSIQKMSRIEENSSYNAHDIELIRDKRIVFIIDEAHRDVFGEMLRTIKETFPNAMFFGFTGTPIHEENQKKIDLKMLERNMGFSTLIQQAAVETVSAIEDLDILDDIEVLRDTLEVPSFARKLSKVKKASPIFKLGISKEAIVEFTKNTPELAGKFKYSEDGTQIRLGTKKSKIAFLKLMNDAFLHSELTKQWYDASAKDNITQGAG